MGCFSNSTDSADYHANYCERCIHWPDTLGDGCAVWDAHMWEMEHEGSKRILNLLIPVDRQGNNLQCAMFVPRPDSTDKREAVRLNTLERPKTNDPLT